MIEGTTDSEAEAILITMAFIHNVQNNEMKSIVIIRALCYIKCNQCNYKQSHNICGKLTFETNIKN